MNTKSNLQVNVVILANRDLHLLDEVLDRLEQRHTEIAIYLDGEQPDLQTQIEQWLTRVYGNAAQ